MYENGNSKQSRPMFDTSQPPRPHPVTRSGTDWVKTLSSYRDPNSLRSVFELAVTIGPYFLLWGLAWWSLQFSYWLTFAISVVNAGFLLRLFAIQHDCGHGAFLRNRLASDWLGRVLGVLTLTPYDVWKRTHSIHHSTSGNLGRRGIGDEGLAWTMDVVCVLVCVYSCAGLCARFPRVQKTPQAVFGSPQGAGRHNPLPGGPSPSPSPQASPP